tara:strand:- start:198 stop:1046 length:849 start_codon:yes stop_codon:yes gene_type:complete
MFVDTETHPYIDLTQLQFPYTLDEVFDEQDFEIASSKKQITENTITKNFVWYHNPYNEDAPVGATLHSNKLAKNLIEWIREQFTIDILTPVKTTILGKKMMPISCLKFHKSTGWHREGFPYWVSKEQQQYLPGRTNFALNFPLYLEDGETYVDFAKGSDEYEERFKTLIEKFIEKVKVHKRNSPATMKDISVEYFKEMALQISEDGMTTTTVMDLMDDINADQLTQVGRKTQYDCPYIIPLSSWHRVTTTGNNRMSFRFLGNNDYTFSQICDLYDKKELFKG